jgi:hypothetical protein
MAAREASVSATDRPETTDTIELRTTLQILAGAALAFVLGFVTGRL